MIMITCQQKLSITIMITLYFSITIMITITLIIFRDDSHDYGWLKLSYKFVLIIMTYYNKL